MNKFIKGQNSELTFPVFTMWINALRYLSYGTWWFDTQQARVYLIHQLSTIPLLATVGGVKPKANKSLDYTKADTMHIINADTKWYAETWQSKQWAGRSKAINLKKFYKIDI